MEDTLARRFVWQRGVLGALSLAFVVSCSATPERRGEDTDSRDDSYLVQKCLVNGLCDKSGNPNSGPKDGSCGQGVENCATDEGEGSETGSGDDDGSADDGSADDGSADGSADDGSADGSADDGSADDGSADDGSADDGYGDDGYGDDGYGDDGYGDDGYGDDGYGDDGYGDDGGGDGGYDDY